MMVTGGSAGKGLLPWQDKGRVRCPWGLRWVRRVGHWLQQKSGCGRDVALTQTQEERLGMSGVETSGFRPLGDPCFPGEGCGNDSGDGRTGSHAR